MKFSPDSTQLAIVRADGLVSVIRVATGQSVLLESPRKRYCENLPSCFFLPASDALVYTYLDEAIKITCINSGRTTLSLELNIQQGVFECNQLIGYRPSDHKLLAAFNGKDDYNNQIDVLDPRNGARTPFIRGSKGYRWSPSNITLSPRGDYLAASVLKEVRSLLLIQWLCAVAVWDARTGQFISETTIDKESNSRGLVLSVFSLAFCPTGNLLVGRRGSIEQVALH
jgi:WD40 repeat protein